MAKQGRQIHCPAFRIQGCVMISQDLYKTIISHVPIVCVDIILRHRDKVLLVKRKNNPLMGDWWVVGGRLNIGESAIDACRRKLKQEVGIDVGNLIFRGLYEDKFDCNSFENVLYHTISLVFETFLDGNEQIVLDCQSEDWGWFDELPSRFIVKTTGELYEQK